MSSAPHSVLSQALLRRVGVDLEAVEALVESERAPVVERVVSELRSVIGDAESVAFVGFVGAHVGAVITSAAKGCRFHAVSFISTFVRACVAGGVAAL
jgi:hypothetical protein